MKIKNKRNIIVILGIITLTIGGTLAYFSSTGTFNNIFNTAKYKTIAHESFVSPDNWLPGDTTEKTVTVTNEGDVPVYARVCLEDFWEAENGTILPNFSTDLNDYVAQINLSNQSNWSYLRDTVNNRDCYIYNSILEEDDTTNSPIASVTFNPNYEGTVECTTDQTTGDITCESTDDGYDNATYNLNITVDTVQADAISEAGWGIGYSGNGTDFSNASSTDALDDSDYRNFLRTNVTPTGIETQVGVRLDDTDYLLTGGDNGTSYSNNKDVLDDIFTSTNCNEETGTPNTYTCSDSTLKLEGYVDSDGNVYIIDSITTPSQKVSIDENNNIEIKIDHTLYGVLQSEASIGTYAKEYVGSHQDSMNVSLSTKKIYYWYGSNDTDGTTILDKNNVIFGGFCWQILRTTDTGGVKLIYNGEPENGQCLSTRSDHKGTVGTSGSSKNLNAAYIYSDTYDYDTSTNVFTLKENKITETWSDSTYRNILGKYTCASGSSTCSTIYQVNGYQNSTTAYITSYTVGNTHYSQIGTSPFNANYYSPAMGGYMYNDVYNYKTVGLSGTIIFGNDVVWNGTKYTLQDTVTLSTFDSSVDTTLSTHHYFCSDGTSECTSVRYGYDKSSTTMYYIELENGIDIEEALELMLSDNNVNRYNSTIKGNIDAWYEKYMILYDSYLEDVIYCNDRSILSLGGWNPDGGSLTTLLQFKEYNETTDLSCTNITDRFSVSNTSAPLTYKVGLITSPEINLLNNSMIITTGQYYWLASPYRFSGNNMRVHSVSTSGSLSNSNVNYVYGVRPSVSLARGTEYSEGDGSEASPFVIE